MSSISPKTFDDAVRQLALEVAEVVIKKQHDYGPNNIMKSLIPTNQAIAVRLNDKLARIVHLDSKSLTPENESMSDSWTDVIGYGLVGKMYNEGTFTLPLDDKAS